MPRRFMDLVARLRRDASDRERARLASILELNRELARAQGLKDLLTALLDRAVRLFAAERAFLIRHREDGELAVEVARSLDGEDVKSAERKISKTIVHKCLGERAGVFCADAREGDFAAAQSVADLKLRSVLCMPLLVGDRCLGCIYLDHRFQSAAFGPDDLPWLQAFADQAAIAVHLHLLLAENERYAAAVVERKRDLEYAVVEQALELAELRQGLTRSDLVFPYDEIIGEAPALLRALQLLDRVVPADFPVLLCGESGTGKEIAARAIHRYGRRSARPLCAVNVAAINPGLLESELFGHVRGAFTGADRDRSGLLREADGGVLFLDEITEMPPELQVKLLRFLEDRLVRPVGGDSASAVDLRVIAATNREPLAAVRAGQLREDLYYRLAVVTIALPPLRERRADVPRLAAAVLAEAAAAAGKPPRTLSPECLQALVQRSWPGNIRQLRNEILRLDAIAAEDPIGARWLEAEAPEQKARGPLDLAARERDAIAEALRVARGNKAEAARLLGISRRALYNKLTRNR
jgi:transcriptional regulator with GAF, ATPase, and Fis domain